ncbi:MAG: hypothetical protein FWH48_10035, partial [Oscillospiraceae bacterium]|nr:hypothetical protein [Oscillospiraceae bacterium]
MDFDKNQSEFGSGFQKEVWWWAVGIVPLEVSLNQEVAGKCSGDILEGCRQWHGYFGELCGDMYENAKEYTPASARQYRNLLENIAAGGELLGDCLVWDKTEWDNHCARLDKSKAYMTSDLRVGRCLEALGRTGLKCVVSGEAVIFSNEKYPKIFCAMHKFELSPNIKKTPARNHFAHCEFRQLFKSYSAGYDELLRRVSDESLHIAHAIHEFAKSQKIQRYIHFDTIKYKHKNMRVL